MNDRREVFAVTDGPRSVAYVRAWARDLLKGRAHPDLTDTSTLALSELVTNALLHARDPIAVEFHPATVPWFAVSDGSSHPPLPRRHDESLLTVGRGLDLVALCSSEWGTRIGATGKMVWFRPRSEPDSDPAVMQTLYDTASGGAPAPARTVTIRLEQTPAADFRAMVQRHRELHRELNLLTLARETAPEARTLLESHRNALGVLGTLVPVQSHPALESPKPGLTSFDFQFVASHPSLIDELVSLLAGADELSAAGHLLWRRRRPSEVEYDLWVAEQFLLQSLRRKPPSVSGHPLRGGLW